MKQIASFLLTIALFLPATASASPGEDWWEIINIFPFDDFTIPIPGTDGIALDGEGIAGDIPDQTDPNKNAIEIDRFANQEMGGFNTLDLLEATFEGILDCIDYCITGFQIRFDFPSSIYFAPIWRHNNADFIVQTFPSLATVDATDLASLIPITIPVKGQDDLVAPWNEWADTIGRAQHVLTAPWAEFMASDIGFDGGATTQQVAGATHSLNYKETEIIGHPYVLIPYLLDRDGNIEADCMPATGTTDDPDGIVPTEPPPLGQDCFDNLPPQLANIAQAELADSEPDPETGEEPPWFEQSPEELAQAAVDKVVETAGSYVERLEECIETLVLNCLIGELLDSTELSRVFSVIDSVTEQIELIQEITALVDTVAQVATLIATGGLPIPQPRIDRFLCPSVNEGVSPELVLPFTPYYLSGIDPAWRSGLIDVPPLSFPTDIHRFTTIINPLSTDTVGVENELWGYINPRAGYTNHPHDAKSAMVNVKRAVDILHEPNRRRLRTNNIGLPPNEDNEFGYYQMIYPFKANHCALEPWDLDRPNNVHGDFMYPGDENRYAYNYWREHECPSTTRGSEIATIEFGGDGICLIP